MNKPPATKETLRSLLDPAGRRLAELEDEFAALIDQMDMRDLLVTPPSAARRPTPP